MLTLFELLAAIITVTATFAWINHRFIKLPSNIGLLVMGLCASLALIGIDALFPDTRFYEVFEEELLQIDFYDTVMNGMLAFLLFAGALHVDLGRLRNRAFVVAALATIGVALSTVIVATGMWLLAQAFGLPLDYSWALVFGALIAPTDPVAVLSTLKTANVPDEMETDMAGESLFNDGIGVVLFTIFLGLAIGTDQGDEASPALHVAELLVVEAGGGIMLGLATGGLAFFALKGIDDYVIEVLISLALVFATYAIAHSLHISGPLAVVVCGILIGNTGAMHAMSEQTKQYVFGFWTLIDEILNAVLFLLIGLEVIILTFNLSQLWLALAAIPLVLAARLTSVGGPVLALSTSGAAKFPKGTIPLLTWGGIRGGISVALALSLPMTDARPTIIVATYAVVLFSIIVQGLTLGRVARGAAQEARGQMVDEAVRDVV